MAASAKRAKRANWSVTGFRGSSPNAVANGPWCELQNSRGAAAKAGWPVISRWLLAVPHGY
jgi:hypothetical protein